VESTPFGSGAIPPLETTVFDPLQFPAPRASTGTTDDADAPGDEHEGENEASSRETNEDMETPEEFEGGDGSVTA
jgi:hypothetical protein